MVGCFCCCCCWKNPSQHTEKRDKKKLWAKRASDTEKWNNSRPERINVERSVSAAMYAAYHIINGVSRTPISMWRDVVLLNARDDTRHWWTIFCVCFFFLSSFVLSVRLLCLLRGYNARQLNTLYTNTRADNYGGGVHWAVLCNGSEWEDDCWFDILVWPMPGHVIFSMPIHSTFYVQTVFW